MRFRQVPQEYEGVLFDGTNAEEVYKFGTRHGEQIVFQTNDEGVTFGMIHTHEGTERIIKGVYVLADSKDQLTRIFPQEIGQRYVLIEDEPIDLRTDYATEPLAEVDEES